MSYREFLILSLFLQLINVRSGYRLLQKVDGYNNFAKNFQNSRQKNSIIDVLQGPKYASDFTIPSTFPEFFQYFQHSCSTKQINNCFWSEVRKKRTLACFLALLNHWSLNKKNSDATSGPPVNISEKRGWNTNWLPQKCFDFCRFI